MVGFRERSTSFIADVKRCEVLAPPVDALVEPLSLLLTALSVRNRVPQIEVAVADNAVALVVRVLEELTAARPRAARCSSRASTACSSTFSRAATTRSRR